MKIGVLGGTRFIGPFVVRSLVREGHEVQVYHRGKTTCELPDGVTDVRIDRAVKGQTTAALRAHRPQAIIDMCAYTTEHVQEVLDAELGLSQYVFCGSTSVYGRIGRSTPDENAPLHPFSAYELGKVACEQLLLSAHREQGFPVSILRLAHPYGPLDQLLYIDGRQSLFLDRMRRKRPILIPGEGDSRVHPVYVEDAAEAFVYAAGRPDFVGRILNLAGDEVLSLDEYFESIARALGKPLVARHVPTAWFEENVHLWAGQKRGFDFGATWCKYESAFDVKALKATGFQFKTNHDKGVENTIAWLDQRGMIPESSDDDLEDKVLKSI